MNILKKRRYASRDAGLYVTVDQHVAVSLCWDCNRRHTEDTGTVTTGASKQKHC